jgi:glutathione S-transferase
MDKLSLQTPVVATYAVAACIMILKAVAMSWLTVARMMQVKGRFRSPEDVKKTILNTAPSPAQLAPNEYVDRIRRIHLNDLENLPFFLVAGLLFVLTAPPLKMAQWLLYGYVVSRLLHFAAYFHGQNSRHPRNAMDRGVGDIDIHDLVDAFHGLASVTPIQTAKAPNELQDD